MSQIRDLKPVFEQFGAFQDGETDDLFQAEKDPYGKRWESLKPKTIAAKERTGGIQKILQHSGRMRASTVSQSSSSEFRHGFNDPKAQFHDQGTRHLPKRQLLPDEDNGLPQRTEEELTAILEDALADSWE